MFNFLKKIFTPFSKIPSFLGQKLRTLLGKGVDETLLEELEKTFYEADLGAKKAAELTEKIRKFASKQTSAEEILQFLKKDLLSSFPTPSPTPIPSLKVILIVGVNGSGKTTSLAKLARHYQKEGKKVLIGAGDTFRAAAVEQLETWASKINVPIVKSKTGSDPSSVAYDAVEAALARGVDIVLIDTAGRLQTKVDLMKELEKIRRVIQKKILDAPHETLLVLDATLGQNAIDQAKTFHQFTPISGIILTKLDGSAKGGIAIAVQEELKIPILWVGLGEKEEDLSPFNPEEYLTALLNL